MPILIIFLLLFFSQAECADLSLAQDPQWKSLLHYHQGWFTEQSSADDQQFFLSKEGTLESELDILINRRHEKEIRCAYPARISWLSKKLNEKFNPLEECPEFAEWFEAINPNALTLIFPSVFLNNPASAFGHTFIRIDAADKRQNLLAYAANFSAATSGENALFYAFLGVFGGYKGFFTVLPYYDLVKKYNDLESRDIWEYELNFTNTETEFLVFHLWELRRKSFKYYYFDENCSYQILALLDVMRPSLELTKKFQGWVIPIDTVKKIIKDESMLKQKIYRPSALTNFRHVIKQVDSEEIEIAKKLVNSDSSSTDGRAIELAQEYYNFLTLKGKIDKKQERSIGLKLLNLRSAAKAGKEFTSATSDVSPDSGHATQRLSYGIGTESSENFQELRWRPAYHSLEDTSRGFLPGVQLRFMETTIRQYESEQFKLEEFNLIDLVSLSPRDAMVKPISWKARIGTERRNINGKQNTAQYLQAGFGPSFEKNEFISYALISPTLETSKYYDQNYMFGLEYKAGVLYDLKKYKFILDYALQKSYLGEDYDLAKLAFTNQVRITDDKQARFVFARHLEDSSYFNEFGLYFDLFF